MSWCVRYPALSRKHFIVTDHEDSQKSAYYLCNDGTIRNRMAAMNALATFDTIEEAEAALAAAKITGVIP